MICGEYAYSLLHMVTMYARNAINGSKRSYFRNYVKFAFLTFTSGMSVFMLRTPLMRASCSL